MALPELSNGHYVYKLSVGASVGEVNKAPGCQLVPVYLNSSAAIAVGLSTHPLKGLFLPELWLPGNSVI